MYEEQIEILPANEKFRFGKTRLDNFLSPKNGSYLATNLIFALYNSTLSCFQSMCKIASDDNYLRTFSTINLNKLIL